MANIKINNNNIIIIKTKNCPSLVHRRILRLLT